MKDPASRTARTARAGVQGGVLFGLAQRLLLLSAVATQHEPQTPPPKQTDAAPEANPNVDQLQSRNCSLPSGHLTTHFYSDYNDCESPW